MTRAYWEFVISFRKGVSCQFYNYFIDSQILDRVESIKDLGVIYDTKLSLEHISSAVWIY